MEELEKFLDLIKPYNKHNLYTKKYVVDEDGVVRGIPATARWTVLRYAGFDEKVGVGLFEEDGEGIIALILNDEDNGFWAVISFLTAEEAKELAEALLKAVAVKE